jgi:hypothetical protein
MTQIPSRQNFQTFLAKCLPVPLQGASSYLPENSGTWIRNGCLSVPSGRLRTSSLVRYQVLTAASKNVGAFWGYSVVESVTRWPTLVRCLLPLALHSSARALACYVTRRRGHGFLSRGTTTTTTTTTTITIGLRVRMPLQTCLCFPCRSLATVYTSSVLSVCLNKSAESWKKGRSMLCNKASETATYPY